MTRVSSHPRIAMLGTGRMGEAVLAGMIQAGWDPSLIMGAEAHEPTARAVHERRGIEFRPAAQAVADAELVVVAVKPHHVAGALDAVAAALSPGATVVSLAAGVATSTLAAHLPPGTPVVRVMPNTPALVGVGMSVMSPGPGCPPESLELAERILAAVGAVRTVPEAQQDAVTAVSGSGPAYVFYLAEAMIDAGAQLGLPPELARDLTVQTLLGAATMLRDADASPAVLRANVTSPGGTTAAAVQVLDDASVKATFAGAIGAARDRSAELGRS